MANKHECEICKERSYEVGCCDIRRMCGNCSGTGEGQWDGSTCTVCKGTGEAVDEMWLCPACEDDETE